MTKSVSKKEKSCNSRDTPLVIDLDGTLWCGDCTIESALAGVRRRPLSVLRAFIDWCRGEWPRGKRRLSEFFDPSVFVWNDEVAKWLRLEKQRGRCLVLCSASDEKAARKAADAFGIFDEVWGSDGRTSLKGKAKAKFLRNKFGHGGFDYVGDSRSDLHVWAEAGMCYCVGNKVQTPARGRKFEKVFPLALGGRKWPDAMRLRQWPKNILLFVPLVASHQFAEWSHWIIAALAFLSLSMMASGQYILNDLLDLDADRAHPVKKNRAIASGQVGLDRALMAWPIFVGAGAGLGLFLPAPWLFFLAGYFVLAILYSAWFKRVAILDAVVLALLYVYRILAGGAVLGIDISVWLLAFALFLFYSLALMKRAAELVARPNYTWGRGYRGDDLMPISCQGISSGSIAALVLLLYIQNPTVNELYRTPMWIAGIGPVLLYAMGHLWKRSLRGDLAGDPVMEAMGDRACQASLLLAFVMFALAL